MSWIGRGNGADQQLKQVKTMKKPKKSAREAFMICH